MLNSSRFCILKDKREWSGLWCAVRVFQAQARSRQTFLYHCPLLPQTAWCMGNRGKEKSFPYPAPPLREILSGGGREKEEKIINITKQVLQNILRSRLPVSASSTIVCEFKKQNTFFTQNWMMLTNSFAITMNQYTSHLYQSFSAQIRYPDSFLPFHYCMKIKKHQHNFYTVYQKGEETTECVNVS